MRIIQCIYKVFEHEYIGCLSIHSTHLTANNSTNNNVVFFVVSNLKIVNYNNY